MSLQFRLLALDRPKKRALALGLAVLSGFNLSISADQPPSSQQLSTEEHLRRPGWWPTRGTANRDDYVGPAVCARCHSALVASQSKHNMARTLTRAADSEVLHAAIGSIFQLHSFQYKITEDTDGTVSASVSNGAQSATDILVWAFGSGAVGQSLLFQRRGAYYETRFSFFPPAKTIDTTPNQRHWVAKNLEQAAGRRLGDAEARRCFACHSTAAVTSDRLTPERLIPGVTCEGCHGPGAMHVAIMKSGIEQGPMEILNPAKMSASDSVDFCGACHGTSWDIVLSGSTGLENVRFPAYRLQKSRCWGSGDVRITCTACHDPHQPLVRDAVAYDSKCEACHTIPGQKSAAGHSAPGCKVATSNCAGCHMAKYELREMHAKFTDHYIRIVRDPSNFPDGAVDASRPTISSGAGRMNERQ
jgi:hypothetical protein